MLKYKDRKRFSSLTAVECNCEGRIERGTVFPEYQLDVAHIPGRGCFPPTGVYKLNSRCFTAFKRERCCVHTIVSSLIIIKNESKIKKGIKFNMNCEMFTKWEGKVF